MPTPYKLKRFTKMALKESSPTRSAYRLYPKENTFPHQWRIGRTFLWNRDTVFCLSRHSNYFICLKRAALLLAKDYLRIKLFKSTIASLPGNHSTTKPLFSESAENKTPKSTRGNSPGWTKSKYSIHPEHLPFAQCSCCNDARTRYWLSRHQNV